MKLGERLSLGRELDCHIELKNFDEKSISMTNRRVNVLLKEFLRHYVTMTQQN